MVTEQGREPKEVARDLGICIDTLRNWLKAAGMQLGQVSRHNREQQRIRELEVEICTLRKQLGEKEAATMIHSHPTAPNLLNRNFFFEHPNQAWVSDITYIPTGEGWLYLAIVKDLCTRKIVGYSFSSRIDTALTLEALNMAVRRCNPPKGLIFHSDRGVPYAAGAFLERL